MKVRRAEAPAIACPSCGAPPGAPCHRLGPNGLRLKHPHRSRLAQLPTVAELVQQERRAAVDAEARS